MTQNFGEKQPELRTASSEPTPYEICVSYATGSIDQRRLIDALVHYPYVAGDSTDGFDTLMVDPPGAWAEVLDAKYAGLIDAEIYESVFNRRHGQRS